MERTGRKAFGLCFYVFSFSLLEARQKQWSKVYLFVLFLIMIICM